MSKWQLANNSGHRFWANCETELEPASNFRGFCGQARESLSTHDAQALSHYRLPHSSLEQIVVGTLAFRQEQPFMNGFRQPRGKLSYERTSVRPRPANYH